MFSSVYSGHQSILIPPLELETSLPVWLSTLSQYKIRDTFCSYSVMELCTKGLGTQTEMLKVRIKPFCLMSEHLFFVCQPQSTVVVDLCVCSGAGCESVLRAELRGNSGGAASSRSHTVLLQTLQRSWPFAARRQHSLRLQGEPGHRPTGGFQTGPKKPGLSGFPSLIFPFFSYLCIKPPIICCLCHQGTSGPDPSTVYVDMKSLRHDRSDKGRTCYW